MPAIKMARDFMVTKLVTLSPHEHVLDGIGKLLNHNITGAPVVDREHRFLGVFSEKCSLNVITQSAQHASDHAVGFSKPVKARDFMSKQLVTLTPAADVFDAIDLLLKNRISGAPVLDREGRFIGVFSEKDSMNVLVAAAYDQLPTTNVGSLMNFDLERTISPETDLFEIAQLFVDTPYRRLAVVEGDRLIGQISRRDVLRAESALSAKLGSRSGKLAPQIEQFRSGGEFPESTNGNQVSSFMDREAATVTPTTGLLDVARVFSETPFRRLPVLQGESLVGQVSRRDVLVVANDLLKPTPRRDQNLLYLSSLVSREDAPRFS